MITNKNLNLFIDWLKTKNGFINLSNGYAGFFHDSTLVLCKRGLASVIHMLPTEEKSDKLIPMSISSPVDSKVDVSFNGWRISIEDCTKLPAESIKGSGKSPTIDLTNALNGEFSYYYYTCAHGKSSYHSDSPTKGELSYSMGRKGSSTKNFFKGFPLTKYFPNIHFGTTCSSCRAEKKCTIYQIKYVYGD